MADNDAQTVIVRVLSQLPDPHSSISFLPLPASLTIAELKQKIRDVLPTKPLPENQRLIYRGRPLTRETDTLLSTFGQEVIRQNEVQSLHLVVREPAVRDARPTSNERTPTPVVMPVTHLTPAPEGLRGPSPATVLQQTPFASNPQQMVDAQAHITASQQDMQHLQILNNHALHIRQRIAQRRVNGGPGQPGGVVLQQPPAPNNTFAEIAPGLSGPPPVPNQHFANIPHAGLHGNNSLLAHQLMPQHFGLQPPQHLHPSANLPQGFPPQTIVHNGVQLPTNMHPLVARHVAQAVAAPSHPLQRSISNNTQNTPSGLPGQSHAPNENPRAGDSQAHVAIRADDPAQAMLSALDTMYASMGIPTEHRQHLHETVGRNIMVPQEAATAEPNGGQISTHGASDGTTQHQGEITAQTQPEPGTGPADVGQNPLYGQAQPQHAPRTLPEVGVTGQRWTMRINTTTMPFPPQPQPVLVPAFQVPHGSPQPMHFALPIENNATARQNLLHGWQGGNHAIRIMVRFQNVLLNLAAEHRQATSSGNTRNSSPSAAITRSTADRLQHLQFIVRDRNRSQAVVNEVLSHGPLLGQTGISPDQVYNLQGMNERFRRLAQEVQSLLSETSVSPAGSASNRATPTQSSTTPTPVRSSTLTPSSNHSLGHPANVVAYLLSSPTGPCALIYTPQGTFGTMQNSGAGSTTRTSSDGVPRSEGEGSRIQGSSRVTPTTVDRHPNPAADQPALPAQPQQELILQQPLPGQAQPPQALQQEDNNLVVALTPFFRTAWFFTRVCAFFWLFGSFGGSNTQRLIITIILSLCYHAFQVGVFRNQQEWLQQHWEGLIGGPEVRPNPAANETAGRNPAHLQRPGEALEPIDAARRLVEERRQQDRGWARQRLRTVERAVALFIASLYPGVGERHVADRERMVREADERNRAAAAEAAAAVAPPAILDPRSVASGAESVAQPEQAAQEGSSGAASVEDKNVTKLSQSDPHADDAVEGSSSSVAVAEDGAGELTQRRREGGG